MKVNYEATRNHINKALDRVTESVMILIYIGHLAMATGLTVAFGDRTDYGWYYTRLGIMILGLIIVGLLLGVASDIIKKRLLKALDEEEQAELARREAA